MIASSGMEELVLANKSDKVGRAFNEITSASLRASGIVRADMNVRKGIFAKTYARNLDANLKKNNLEADMSAENVISAIKR